MGVGEGVGVGVGVGAWVRVCVRRVCGRPTRLLVPGDEAGSQSLNCLLVRVREWWETGQDRPVGGGGRRRGGHGHGHGQGRAMLVETPSKTCWHQQPQPAAAQQQPSSALGRQAGRRAGRQAGGQEAGRQAGAQASAQASACGDMGRVCHRPLLLPAP
jgi:hypothetical protein